MGDKTGIEWTDATWNPLAGCSVVSPGCTNCYAMKMAARLDSMDAAAFVSGGSKRRMPQYDGATKFVNGNAVWTGKVAMAPDSILMKPLQWKRPRKIFVNSMSDLFHEAVPDDWIDQIFAIMALCPQHTFQVLTKRSKRMREYFGPSDELGGMTRDVLVEGGAQKLYHARTGEDPSMWLAVHWPLPNVWLGVSAEDQTRADERIPDLLATPAAVRFVSAEPLLGPIDFTSMKRHTGEGLLRPLDGRFRILDWIIVGGESGTGARLMQESWVAGIVGQCRSASVPVFVKQLSGLGGRAVKDIALFPPDLQVREFPVTPT